METGNGNPCGNPGVLSVSELTRQIKDALEGEFSQVVVRGELSGVKRVSSGHVYFALKDEVAQIRVALWRTSAAKIRFRLQDGLDVVIIGRIEVYPPQGTYKLIAEELIPQGIGEQQLAFRQLCERLKAEGLFDSSRKRALPVFPGRIALITSPTGAAVRDMLQVLKTRWPLAEVVIIPVRVQGEGAAESIAAGIRRLGVDVRADVAVVGRGGGSAEDLSAFNQEVVARGIAGCVIPIVSAVGHEIDVTLADLVADRRAVTPTDAATILVQDASDLLEGLRKTAERMTDGVRAQIERWKLRVRELMARRVLSRPQDAIFNRGAEVDRLKMRLERSMHQFVQSRRSQLMAVGDRLEALGPESVLRRGYSITFRAGTGRPLTSAASLRPGEKLMTRLAEGTVESTITGSDAN